MNTRAATATTRTARTARTARGHLTTRRTPLGPLLRRWPALLGLASAGLLLVAGADRDTLTRVVSIAALCYLGAAALSRPWVAWAGIFGGSAVVVASELLGVPWWAGLGVTGVALVAAGLLRRAPLPPLTAQTAALLGYGGLAGLALLLEPRAGLVLAALVLASHAVWDAVHHRRDQVVSRSLAEYCMFFDVPLALGAVLLALS